MGLLTFVGRILLVVLNIIFILASLCLVATGFVLRFAHEFVRTKVKNVLDELEDDVKTLYSQSDFKTENLDLGELVQPLAIALIVVGVCLLAMSFVGCCGACCNFSTIMLVYAIVLIVLLAGQVAIVVVAFAVPHLLQGHLDSGLKEMIKEYEGLSGTKLSSLGLNFVMKQYDCCGATDYTDFESNTEWKTKDGTGITFTGAGTLLTPVACCATIPAAIQNAKTCAGDSGDASYDQVTGLVGSNYNKGCVDGIWQGVLFTNTLYFFIIVGLCWAVQIVIIIFAILVYKDRGVTGGLV